MVLVRDSDLVRLNLDRMPKRTKLILRALGFKHSQENGGHFGYTQIITMLANEAAEVLTELPAAVLKKLEHEIDGEEHRKPRKKPVKRTGAPVHMPPQRGSKSRATA